MVPVTVFGGSDKTYDLRIDRADASGKLSFRHGNLTILGTDTHVIEYANWTSTDQVTLCVDHGSDGTIDETFPLQNQPLLRVYLPLVPRNR